MPWFCFKVIAFPTGELISLPVAGAAFICYGAEIPAKHQNTPWPAVLPQRCSQKTEEENTGGGEQAEEN